MTLGLGNRYDSALDYPEFVLGILLASAISYGILAEVMKALGAEGVLAIAAELVFHETADHFLLETTEG